MSILDIIFLSIGLAMDCLAVSIASGIILGRIRMCVVLRMAILFGLFQALMPLIGWLVTSLFSSYVSSYDHWIAFGMLAFLGGRMIKESFDKGESGHFAPDALMTQMMLAVATSIDAAAAGISFACLGYDSMQSLIIPLSVIGLFSFFFSVVGNFLGVKCGVLVKKRLNPELLGGITLIIIGIKVLFTHLLS